jgi:hypothetical protein
VDQHRLSRYRLNAFAAAGSQTANGEFSRLAWISGTSSAVRYLGTTSAWVGTIRVAMMPPRMTCPKIGLSLDSAYAAAVHRMICSSHAPPAWITVLVRYCARFMSDHAVA